MARSNKFLKRKRSESSSTTSHKKIRRSTDASESASPPSPTFSDLPLDVTTRIISYLLDSDYSNIPSHSNSIMMMASLACPSYKILRSAVDHHLEPYAKSITAQRWDRLPRPFVKLVCAEALRMKINGVTKKTAMALMVPESILCGGLRYTVHRFPRRCYSAHIYKVQDIFSYLSAVYPTVEAYETALETKYQASNSTRLKREENKRVRAGREAEIRAIMKEFHVGEEYKHDENIMNLVKKYVTNGSKKNLPKIKEYAREAGLPNARRAEVDELIKVNGVHGRTVKLAEKEEYSKTGDESLLESIKSTIQAEKDRLGRLDGNRKQFHETLLKLTDGKEWVLQVPDYIWTRNAIIQEFLEHGMGDVTEACSAILSVLHSKRNEDGSTESIPTSVQKYVMELRREDLDCEFRLRGLTVRTDSEFYEQFIQGTTKACVQEVVAMMALSAHLLQVGGVGCWEFNEYKLARVMQKRYYSGECDEWYAAFESVKSLVDHSGDYYSHCDVDCLI